MFVCLYDYVCIYVTLANLPDQFALIQILNIHDFIKFSKIYYLILQLCNQAFFIQINPI